MPFENLIPRPLTSAGIQTYAPHSSGVYGISNAREWIYIGEADDIHGALLDHLEESGTDLMNKAPTGFVYEACSAGVRNGRQDRLVMEYEPVCNRRRSRQFGR